VHTKGAVRGFETLLIFCEFLACFPPFGSRSAEGDFAL
jgi:hypothetical protein